MLHQRCRMLSLVSLPIVLSLLAGCSPIDSPPPPHAQQNSDEVRPADDFDGDVAVAEPEVATQTGQSSNVSEPSAPEHSSDIWDVSYIQGAKVGTFHTSMRPLHEDGRELIEIKHNGELTLNRFGQPITQKIGNLLIETPEGEVVRFGASMSAASMSAATATISMQGEVDGRTAKVTVDTLGKKTSSTITWDPQYGGFFAADQSMRRKPLVPGETRTFKALMPLPTSASIAELTLHARDYETTKLLDGEAELLKIDVTMKSGGVGDIASVSWTDRRGEVIKQFQPGMDLTTYRVSSKFARSQPSQGFDIGEFSTVLLSKPLPNAARTKRVVYRVALKGSDPAEVFPAGVSQQVKSTGERAAELTVIAVRPDSPAKLATKPTPPVDGDLASNNLIQSDDEAVVKMAREVLPDERDTWKLAQALEQAVFTKMTAKNFSQAFATAAEVARTREGDCTEHAVLLAAMCRARNIPARVAIGLVYYAPMQGFAYHMWNEVWVHDRWVPLDATAGLGGVGADRIKLVDSNLEGADGYSTFLPVAKVMGQLSIEVMEAQ